MPTSSSLTRFGNDLTVDPSNNEQRKWNFIPFPPTNKKICVSRSGFKLSLRQCPEVWQKTWATQFPKMRKEDVQHWHHFHTQSENHCSSHRVCVSTIDETHMFDDPREFIVGAHEDGSDVDFPADCQNRLHCHSKPITSCLDQGGCPSNQLIVHSPTQSKLQLLGTPECHAHEPPKSDQISDNCAVPPNKAGISPFKISFSTINSAPEWLDFSATCLVPLAINHAKIPSLSHFTSSP